MIRAVQELDIVHERVVIFLADELVELGGAELRLDFAHLLRSVRMAIALEGDHTTAGAVEHAAEVPAAADRPVHGVRADAQHGLDLFHELEGVADLAVELVHEREDGDAAQGAHLEELLRLRLDALGAVDHHDKPRPPP